MIKLRMDAKKMALYCVDRDGIMDPSCYTEKLPACVEIIVQ